MAMAAALSIHAALVLPFLTRPSTQIRIQQPEVSVTITPPSRETQPDAANQASVLHTQGEQQRTTTPGRVILKRNAATQTRGHASDVLLAELDFNKTQLSGQGEGEGQANATIKNARAGYVHRWRQHIQTVGSDFA